MIPVLPDRLLLRAPTFDDAQAIFNYRSDVNANRYQGWIPTSVNEVVDRIASSTAQHALDHWQSWVLELDHKQVIGDVALCPRAGGVGELGCTLDTRYHGNGFAAKALTALVNYSVSTYGIRRFKASIDPRNTAARRLVVTLGMQHKQTIVDAFELRGERVDDAIYELEIMSV